MTTHYVITRSDLPTGFQAAQIVHAVGESVSKAHSAGTNAVVLTVTNEYNLRELSKKLALGGIAHALIRETDEPYAEECTAIGICPIVDRLKVKPYLSKLPLLGQEKSHMRPALIEAKVNTEAES